MKTILLRFSLLLFESIRLWFAICKLCIMRNSLPLLSVSIWLLDAILELVTMELLYFFFLFSLVISNKQT